jgi:hypothetical protein
VTIAFDAVAVASGSPVAGISVSHSLGYPKGNWRIVLAGVHCLGALPHTFSVATYNGEPMSQLVQVSSGSYSGVALTLTMFVLLDTSLSPNSGSYTGAFTATNATSGQVTVSSYVGVRQELPQYVSVGNNSLPAFSGPQSTPILPVATPGSLVDFFGIDSSSGGADLYARDWSDGAGRFWY